MIWKSKSSLPVEDYASLFVTWITLLMVFISVLVLTGLLSLTNIINSWQRSISGSLTVQIPTYTIDGDDRKQQASQDIQNIIIALKDTHGIKEIHLLNPQEMQELMAPWLGASENIQDLPLPLLLDIQIDSPDSNQISKIKTTLEQVAPKASLDSHRVWLAHLIQTAKSIQNMIVFILILLILTTSFTVIYTTSSNMALQSHITKLLHMMGARNFTIARQYASSHFVRAFMGGIIGFVLALPIIWITSTLFNPLQNPLFSSGTLSLSQIYIIISIPLWASFLAFMTALLTVLKTLRHAL